MSKVLENNSQICAQLEAAIEVVEILTAIPEQIKSKEDIIELLREKGSYLDKIKFSPNRQPSHIMLSDKQKGKDLLEDAESPHNQKLSPEFLEKIINFKTADEARTFLSEELNRHGLSLETIAYQPPISHDERHIIRMDFNGKAYKQSEDYLSDTYLNLLDNPSSENFDSSSYNLEENSSWQTFKKFPRFQLIEHEFKNALQYANIPPSALKDLNSFDFEDILFKYKTRENEHASSASLFQDGGARANAVKIHTQNHRNELKEYFKSIGAQEGDQPGQIDFVLNQMQRKGNIPPLMLPNNEFLTATVHHNVDITDAGLLGDITKVNSSQNFSIIFQKNANDNEQDKANFVTQLKASDRRFTQAINDYKIDTEILPEEINLGNLAENKENKANFIKQVTRKKYQELYMAFKAMGVEQENISSIILTMANEGKVPQLLLPQNKMLVLGVKKSRRPNQGLQLYFGTQNAVSNYDDIHQSILHGIDKRPSTIEITDDPKSSQNILYASNNTDKPNRIESEKDAYEITNNGNVMKKVFFRIRMKFKQLSNFKPSKQYPIFVLGGLDKDLVIWSNEKDSKNAHIAQINLNKKVIESHASKRNSFN